jgi:D-alanyl-D-alanine carboxypeptidase
MKYGGRPVLGHQGGLPGYVTVMCHDQDAGLSYALSANTGSGNRLSFFATGIHAVLDEIVATAHSVLAPV